MFLHRRGKQFSTRPFTKPTSDLFRLWLRDYLNENPNLKYDVFLVGAFCENIFGESGKKYDTLDIDIALCGDVLDLYNLKSGLISAFEIGKKYDLLIDVAWRSELLPSMRGIDVQEKIISYLDVEDINDKGEGRVYTMSGIVTPLGEDLYHFRDYDISSAKMKFYERAYTVPFKKIA